MLGALLYLRLTSLRNLLIFRLRRLKQPKYLVGAVVAGLYLYFFFFRRTAMMVSRGVPAPAVQSAQGIAVIFLCVAVTVPAVLRIAYAWIAPPENPGLRFTEAEIAFLFPAPFTRKSLIHFRLLSSQIAILFTSLLLVLFFRRFSLTGNSRLLVAVGWWVVLSTFDLHLNGTNLMLSRMKDTGSRYVLVRLAAVAAIVLYAAAIVVSAGAYINAHPDVLSGPAGMDAGLRGLAASNPLHWILLPFRIVFGPYFANGARDFWVAMVPALGLLALHYYWVSSTQARFEEGSIALAEKRAATRAAALRGDLPRMGGSAPKPLKGPFPLPPEGLPEIAFLWKNVLSMRSTLLTKATVIRSVLVIVFLSISLKPLLAVHARASGGDVYGPIIAMFCGIFAAYTLLLGPQVARQDLRNDLPSMDLLKTYPLEGWRLALGELLAPTAILTLILWVCIIVCSFAIDSSGSIEWLTPGVRVATALSLALAAPVFCFLQLIVPNTVMVIMPGWYQSSRSRGGGIELMGQRMILGLGQLLVAALVAAPATLAAMLIIFSAHLWIGVGPAIVVAALVVLTILGGEAAVGLWWLGERFGKFDLSSESR